MTARTSRPTMTKRLIAPVAVMATIPAVSVTVQHGDPTAPMDPDGSSRATWW